MLVHQILCIGHPAEASYPHFEVIFHSIRRVIHTPFYIIRQNLIHGARKYRRFLMTFRGGLQVGGKEKASLWGLAFSIISVQDLGPW